MYVYALGDPRTGGVRYIGKAHNVFSRYAQHITAKPRRDKTRKDQWIDDLKQNLMIPTLTILESGIPKSRVDEREKHWIYHYLALGALLTNTMHGTLPSEKDEHPKQKSIPQDITRADYCSAKEAASILSLNLQRPVRPDSIHRVIARLGLCVHRIDQTHSLYLRSEIETITEKDFPGRKPRKTA